MPELPEVETIRLVLMMSSPESTLYRSIYTKHACSEGSECQSSREGLRAEASLRLIGEGNSY